MVETRVRQAEGLANRKCSEMLAIIILIIIKIKHNFREQTVK